jgi:hypothetical protein
MEGRHAPIDVETSCGFTLAPRLQPALPWSQFLVPKFWAREYSVSKPVLNYGSGAPTTPDTTAGFAGRFIPSTCAGCLAPQDQAAGAFCAARVNEKATWEARARRAHRNAKWFGRRRRIANGVVLGLPPELEKPSKDHNSQDNVAAVRSVPVIICGDSEQMSESRMLPDILCRLSDRQSRRSTATSRKIDPTSPGHRSRRHG